MKQRQRPNKRSPRSSSVMSLETATLMIAGLLMAPDLLSVFIPAITQSAQTDNPILRDEAQAAFKRNIEWAAEYVSQYLFIDGMRHAKTAKELALYHFVVLKTFTGNFNNNKQTTTNKLMKEVWERIKDHDLVRKELVAIAARRNLESEAARGQLFRNLRNKM